jgi:hypothetical protein
VSQYSSIGVGMAFDLDSRLSIPVRGIFFLLYCARLLCYSTSSPAGNGLFPLEIKRPGYETNLSSVVFLYTLYTGNIMFLYLGNTFVMYGFLVTNNVRMCMYILVVTQVSRCLLINRVRCVLSNPSSVIIYIIISI